MADETTPSDTTSSQTPTDAAPADAPAVDTPADAPADADTPADDADSSVLGAPADDADAPDDAPDADAPQGPPETYELALKDADGNDVALDPDAVAAAEPVFRELGLTNDQANQLMPVAKDFADRTASAVLQQVIADGAAQKAEWLAAFKADAEIGGAHREETEHLAAKGLDALGFTLTGYGEDKKQPHPFRKVLTETGFGNHPDMIRMARKLGEMVGEDGFERAGAGQSGKADRLEALYPDDVPKTA